MSTISAYRVTPEDLPDLDRKTRWGLRPLLDKLNTVLQPLVSAANTPSDVVTTLTSFTTTALGAAYVELSNPITSRPRCVLVAELQRLDALPIDSVYGFWWTRTPTGIRGLFVGLNATTTYLYTLRVQ